MSYPQSKWDRVNGYRTKNRYFSVARILRKQAFTEKAFENLGLVVSSYDENCINWELAESMGLVITTLRPWFPPKPKKGKRVHRKRTVTL